MEFRYKGQLQDFTGFWSYEAEPNAKETVDFSRKEEFLEAKLFDGRTFLEAFDDIEMYPCDMSHFGDPN